MASYHKFIDHTADIAVQITADSFEELIQESLIAFNESVLDSVDKKSEEELEIDIQDSSREGLLVSFLNEINFLLIVKKWISKSVDEILIRNEENNYKLNCKLKCSRLTNDIDLKEEIKSVTYHRMEIKEENGILSTSIVFDI
ncbi:MAG: archease [Ignavibacteriaceae bacterium]